MRKHAKRPKRRDKVRGHHYHRNEVLLSTWQSLKGRKGVWRSLITFQVLLPILILLLSIFSAFFCPKVTKNESAVCHNLSVARELIFDGSFLTPLNEIANHPAFAHHIAHANPVIKLAFSIFSIQCRTLYKEFELLARPYVVQMRREYNAPL